MSDALAQDPGNSQQDPGSSQQAKLVERPKFQFLRFKEDWSKFGRERETQGGVVADEEVWDPIKYIPLNDEGDWWVSYGGHMRVRGEGWSDFGFGGAPDNDQVYGLWRLAVHADAHFGETFRVFVEGKSALATDRDLPGGNRPLDIDTLALEQAFADVKVMDGEDGTLTLRGGRMALLFGKQRLVSPLPWSNTMRRWDGASGIYQKGSWTTTAFWTQFAPTDKYEFNSSDSSSEFWGVYGTGNVTDDVGADLYYLGIDRRTPTFNATSGREERHSVGTRIFGDEGAFDYDVEATYQFGRVGKDDVSAYSFASQFGYRFEGEWDPRAFVGFDLASGDNKAGGDVQTFNQLFPLGHAFLGYIDAIGRQNIIDLSAGTTATPMERMTLGAAGHVFWRQSTDDSVYNAGGGILRSGALSSDRFVGVELDFTVKYVFDRHISALLGYSHFFAGDFIDDTGADDDIDFVYLQSQYTF
jgi:hypothetical protein